MNPKVRFCVAAYFNDGEYRINTCFACVYSILAQTYDNYEIYIHHDGPLNDPWLADKFRELSNKIFFIETTERKGSWGFYDRWNISQIKPHADWIVYTNDDNYYVPKFLEIMIFTALTRPDSKMVYCDMVHNGYGYGFLSTFPAICRIDLGAYMSHNDIVKETHWTEYGNTADGWYAEQLSLKTSPIKAPGILFVHN